MRNCAESEKTEYAGMSVAVLGFIAGEETCRLVKEQYDFLHRTLPSFYLEMAGDDSCYTVDPLPEEVVKAVSFLYPIGKEGLLAALWNLGESCRTGMELQMREFPFRQETIEICEAVDINPYEVPSSGTYLAAVVNGPSFASLCRKKGIPCRLVGTLTRGCARTLENTEGIRYLDKPRHTDNNLEKEENTIC